MKSLNELAEKYNTDKKGSHHGYAEIYDSYFRNLREERLTLLEIGVKKGASLKMFEEYFKNGLITGVDIEPGCKKFENDRIEIFIGDQASPHFLYSVNQKAGPFDIIIDDGGHTWRQQIISFSYLFPQLKLGGLYAIEDVHTSYMINPKYIKYQDNKVSCVDFMKRQIDRLNYQKKYGPCDYEYIHFYKSLVIIKKI